MSSILSKFKKDKRKEKKKKAQLQTALPPNELTPEERIENLKMKKVARNVAATMPQQHWEGSANRKSNPTLIS